MSESKKKETVGMYMINDPNYPQVRVGKFTILRQDSNSVWIYNNDSEEGGAFHDKLFEAAIEAFFEKYF